MDTLFVIDSDQICQFITGHLLKRYSLFEQIVYFDEAKQVIQFLLKHGKEPDLLPDVIFLELNLPELDGWDFLDALKLNYSYLSKEIKVYIVSVCILNRHQVERIKHYSFVERVVLKPLTKEFLLEIPG